MKMQEQCKQEIRRKFNWSFNWFFKFSHLWDSERHTVLCRTSTFLHGWTWCQVRSGVIFLCLFHAVIPAWCTGDDTGVVIAIAWIRWYWSLRELEHRSPETARDDESPFIGRQLFLGMYHSTLPPVQWEVLGETCFPFGTWMKILKMWNESRVQKSVMIISHLAVLILTKVDVITLIIVPSSFASV